MRERGRAIERETERETRERHLQREERAHACAQKRQLEEEEELEEELHHEEQIMRSLGQRSDVSTFFVIVFITANHCIRGITLLPNPFLFRFGIRSGVRALDVGFIQILKHLQPFLICHAHNRPEPTLGASVYAPISETIAKCDDSSNSSTSTRTSTSSNGNSSKYISNSATTTITTTSSSTTTTSSLSMAVLKEKVMERLRLGGGRVRA